jgi:cytochrome c oxidase cbb3-type subunit 3
MTRAAFISALAAIMCAGQAGAQDAAALFLEHCAACHGDDGAGVAGVAPNLTDADWIWGDDERSVYDTIAYGVRNESFFARNAEMPRFGADGLLTSAEIADLTAWLLEADGRTDEAAAAGNAERGGGLFESYCATCHGEAAEGQRAMGAPRLTDDVWLFGGDGAAIAEQIADPQHGVMPGWLDILGDEAVGALTRYVRNLSASG